jgi:uncharacterized protein
VTPTIYDASLVHIRREPITRVFRHRVYLWLVDLDELPVLPRLLRPLARFHPADHFGLPDRSIRDNLEAWLAIEGVDLAGGKVLMLANARVLGYVFNPLTVFWCHNAAGELVCVVAEVHNTYGERHCYLLRPEETVVRKDFYVSPFLPLEGTYRMRLPEPGERLRATVSLTREGRSLFTATLTGQRRAANLRGILRAALTRPLMPQRVSALIRAHGIALWLRRLPVVPRQTHVPQEGVQ